MAAGLVVIALADAAVTLVFSRSIADRIVLREVAVAQEFLDSIVNAEDIGSRLFDPPALQSFSTHVVSLPDIVRANVYAPDGFIRFSTEPNLIGLGFSDNDELTRGLAGELIAKLEEVSEGDKTEHLALNRLPGVKLVEAYIPVRDHAGQVVAVVEFYRKPDAVEAIIGAVTQFVWLSAALSGAIIVLASYALFRRPGTAR